MPARNITILSGQCNYLNQFLPVDQLHYCDNNFQNPYTQQWNLGFEHDLGGGWLFAMDYIGSHTIHIEQPVRLNAPSDFVRTAPGQVRSVSAANKTRPIVPVAGGYQQVLQYVNAGSPGTTAFRFESLSSLPAGFRFWVPTPGRTTSIPWSGTDGSEPQRLLLPDHV